MALKQRALLVILCTYSVSWQTRDIMHAQRKKLSTRTRIMLKSMTKVYHPWDH